VRNASTKVTHRERQDMTKRALGFSIGCLMGYRHLLKAGPQIPQIIGVSGLISVG